MIHLRTIASLAVLSVSGIAAAQTAQDAGSVITVAGQSFATWQEYTSSDIFRAYGLRCGIRPREERLAEWEASGGAYLRSGPQHCALNSTSPQSIYEPGNGQELKIPVVWHVLHSTSNAGNISRTRIEEQIEILNEDFRALAGTNGAPGTDTKISFFLATVDPLGNPTSGITRTANNTWYNDSGAYYNTLAWDTNRYLNIYSNLASGALGYVPGLPQGGIVGNNADRVVILHTAVGRNAPIGAPYNQGRTTTHEVGHYLGLEHTFAGGCGTSSCYTTGDLICDTNAENSPTFGCPGVKNSCSSLDPFHNYMDYSDDLCMFEFSPEQANRMRCTLLEWRPNLPETGCQNLPSASVRNAGSNPNVFTTSAPTIGLDLNLSVATAPYDFAILIGYAGSANVPLAGGQTLLVDLGSPKIFQIGPIPGPNVNLNLGIPYDTTLCGLSLSTQSVLYGGTTPYALTNAVDMTIGS